MWSLISVCLTAIPYAVYGADFSWSQAQDLLDIHNAARAKVSGCAARGIEDFLPPAQYGGLQPLEWDWTLAAAAAEKAESCDFQHWDDFGYGENLYCSWTNTIDMDNEIIKAGAGWIDEELTRYRYGKTSDQDNCWKVKDKNGQTLANPEWDDVIDGNCGHYTQVIWDTSTKIGCGYAICNTGSCDVMISCAFDPPGNYAREPYTEGTNSDCDADYVAPPTPRPTTPAPIPAAGACAFIFEVNNWAANTVNGYYYMAGQQSDGTPFYMNQAGTVYIAKFYSYWVVTVPGKINTDTGVIDSSVSHMMLNNDVCGGSTDFFDCDAVDGWSVTDCNGGFEEDATEITSSSQDAAVIAIVVVLVVLVAVVAGGVYWFYRGRGKRGQVEFNDDIGIDEEEDDEVKGVEKETEMTQEIEVEVPITSETQD